MNNIFVLQKEIDDLNRENTLLTNRLAKATDDSSKLFLQNLINYNEESIAKLVDLQNAQAK